MTNDDDLSLLVTETVANTPPGGQYPGSEVRWCHICAEAIWLSLVALEKMERDPTLRPTCAACAVPIMEQTSKATGGTVPVRPIDPNENRLPLRDILDHLKRKYGST